MNLNLQCTGITPDRIAPINIIAKLTHSQSHDLVVSHESACDCTRMKSKAINGQENTDVCGRLYRKKSGFDIPTLQTAMVLPRRSCTHIQG